MKLPWANIISVVLGIGAGVLGVLLPPTAPFAFPAATGLITAGLPSASAAIAKVRSQ